MYLCLRFDGVRIFMALFLFMFYTITMAYRGSLKSALTVTLVPQPIDSVKELALEIQEKVSKVTSVYFSTSLILLFPEHVCWQFFKYFQKGG